MDPILQEIYSTVLTAAPYVIIAYALLFAILLIYVIYANRSLSKTEQQLAALEEAVQELEQKH